MRVRRQVDILGDCRPREPVHAAARRHGGPPGAEGPARCPRSPVGCFAIPDAISQLEALDRQLLTRQDVERLFGGRQGCAPPRSCRPSGPSSSATRGTLPRTKLLQLKKHCGRASFRVEEERRARLVAELQEGPADPGSGSRCRPRA